MAIMVMNFEVDDYDTWKAMFDEDPAGRRASGATGHMVSRAVDNPNEGFIRVDFPFVEQAKAFREGLVASGIVEQRDAAEGGDNGRRTGRPNHLLGAYATLRAKLALDREARARPSFWALAQASV